MEKTRIQLEEKSLGLDFLIDVIEDLEERVKENGCLSPADERVLVHVCGVEDRIAKICILLNQISKGEKEKLKKDEAADKATFEENQQILVLRLKAKLQDLRAKRETIRRLESIEEKCYIASLVMPPAECSEKIHRAEAALERRLFKILNYLLAIQGRGIASINTVAGTGSPAKSEAVDATRHATLPR